MTQQISNTRTYLQKPAHAGNFKFFFLAKTTIMFTLVCFGVGRIFLSMTCIFSIFLSRSCKRMTDVKIQNLLRDNRSILRKGLVLHTIAYIRDLHTYVYVKIFSSNRRSSSFDLKLLWSPKKSIRSLLHVYVVIYGGPYYPIC